MDRITNREYRPLVEAFIDNADILTLDQEIKKIADRCSKISKQLEDQSISESEKEKLGEELRGLVEKGTKKGARRNQLLAKYAKPEIEK